MNVADQNGVVVRLTASEMQGAKALWKEIFFEDSDMFTDYYFQEKMNDNIEQIVKAVNYAYKVSKSNFIWQEKVKSNIK